MIVRIIRKDELIMLKQRVIKWFLIVLLVCCSVIIMGILFLRPIYLREKTDTEEKILTFLKDSDVKNPMVSIRGNTLVVKWITRGYKSCVEDDFDCMEETHEQIKNNFIIRRIRVYVYSSDGEIIYDYPKKGGVVSETQANLRIKIPPPLHDWFVENYGPPSRRESK